MEMVVSAATIVTSVATAVISILAFRLSLQASRREQDVRSEALEDRRRAQARLVTGWWTRVGPEGEDMPSQEFGGSSWTGQAGFRIWIANGSDQCVYECFVTTPVTPVPDAGVGVGLQGYPYLSVHGDMLFISVGTLPPGERLAYFLDPRLASNPGELTIQFRDSDRRIGSGRAGS